MTGVLRSAIACRVAGACLPAGGQSVTMRGKSLAIGLKTSFQPVTGGDHAMSVHLRLLAEHASEALAEHEAARMVSEAERIKRICHGS